MTLGPIVCHYGGNVGHSLNPHVHQAFKRARTRYGKDIGGGGAELNCCYTLRVKDKDYDEAIDIFKDRLTKDEMKKVLL